MTDTAKKDDGDTEIVVAVMNAKLPCGQYVFEAVDKAEVRAIIAAAKPMIERSMLNDMIDFFKGRSRDVAIYVRARGIDLEAKSVADSVSRRADLNCEPSGEPLQNGLKPAPGDEKAGEGMDHPSPSQNTEEKT